MDDKAQLRIIDITGQLPMNPRQPRIPLRTVAPTMIVWHCDAALNWTVHDLVRYDLAPNHISPKGCPCPTYQYYVTRDGKLYKIAQEAWVTWHAGVSWLQRKLHGLPDYNQIGLAICFAHDPSKEREGLTTEQMETGFLLTAEITLRRDIQSSAVKGHRELPITGYAWGHPEKLRKTCPGLDVDMDAARKQVHQLKLEVLRKDLVIEVVYGGKHTVHG